MLISLHIENIAVIRSLDLDFYGGFHALTGETGAGKSIIIDGVSLLIGAKAERELIRTGESFAMVSGLFSSLDPFVLERLGALGITADEDGTLLIERRIGADGKSSVRINGRAVSLTVLREISPYLLTIHGQNDTRSLADAAKHLEILDTYAENGELLSRYRELYGRYESASRELRELYSRERDSVRLSEMLAYQIRDIDSVGVREGEEDELLEQKLKYKSSERIRKNAGFVFKALRGSEKGSAAYLLDKSISALTQISDVIPACEGYAETLRDMLYSLSDIAEEAYAITEEAEAPLDINEIEERLDKISKLKRKYGLTVGEVLAFRERAAREYKTLENLEDEVKALEEKKASLYREALAVAETLHARRTEAAERLEGAVKAELSFLDMPKVVFFTSIKEEYEGGERVLLPNGTDRAEFYISANRGAEPQPMAKIASGGELARIMLALKVALADKDAVPTLIFDEIDAGVSGKTARKIGLKMKELSSTAQVFSVTHSAQIASLANTHYLIKKSDENGATETRVSELDQEGRIDELSRILGGIHVTEAQRAAAVDMLAPQA